MRTWRQPNPRSSNAATRGPRPQGRTSRFLFLATLVAVILTGFTRTYAHEMRPAYLEIKEMELDTYDIVWKVPAKEGARLGLYVRFPDGTENQSEPVGSLQGGGYIERFRIYQEGGLADKEIHIDGLRSTLTDVLVRYQALGGATQIARLTPEHTSIALQAVPGKGEVARTYTELGVQHIWKGVDHLLFVACLMMVAGRGRKLIATITGFTIAHSLTLALSTLNVVHLPIAPVEATIALSILFLAVEIAKGRKDSLTYRYPVSVSASFGLLHGFGFAAVLNEIGLPTQDIPLALLFFNVGVEVGQILFVLAVIVMVIVTRKLPVGPVVRSRFFTTAVPQRMAIYAIGSLAAFWIMDRMTAF